MSADDVAAYLQIPAKTLANWRSAGLGPPFFKIGRHVRYELQEVIAWRNTNRKEPA